MSFYQQSSNYQQSKANASLRNSKERQPLDNAQLNAVMRNVFAWMTVGTGISAWVASLLSGAGLDSAFTIFNILAVAIILQFALAFGLYGKAQRFSPATASFFFIIYAVVVGACFFMFFSLLAYPDSSSAATNACLAMASLFAVMTLVAWKSKRDFSDRGGYFLMGLLGLLVAAAVNRLLPGNSFGNLGDGLGLSLISAALAVALTAFMTERIARMGADPRKSVNPNDAVRFSVLAALKLYLSMSVLSVILPIVLLQKTMLRGRYNYRGESSYFWGSGMFGNDFGEFEGDGGGFGDGFGGFDGDVDGPGGDFDGGFDGDVGD
ncbi:MAG: Bax inhibitor-1 family protein [Chloroflexi bacterium]|nr:Bax inhibitor-1 family protein [Chloroflexota bacterium]